MTGFVKIPMQFLILLIGALLVAFYQFTPAPLFFNQSLLNKAKQTEQGTNIIALEAQQLQISEQKKTVAYQVLNQPKNETTIAQLNQLNEKEKALRAETKTIIKQAIPLADTNDTNYIFLDFVMRYLPQGLIGLLIAVIFCASWSSTSSELNALASTTIVDIYKRLINKNATDKQYVTASRITTLLWGLFAIGVAQFASALGSLIEAVNVLGSLFYGSILGIFLTAFFLKNVKGNAVFIAAIISETIIIAMYVFDVTAFLWLNLIGCALVMGLSSILNIVLPKTEETTL